MISPLLVRRGIDSPKKTRFSDVIRQPNEFTLCELSQKTNIPESTLYGYLKKGMLNARHVEISRGLWLVTADEEEIKRLKALKDRPPEWLHRSRAKKVN
jgi:predicted transcriptional regulator